MPTIRTIAKRALQIFVSLMGLLVLSLLLILMADKQRTQYLLKQGHQSLKTDNYLIRNANVIPMDRDTVLREQAVLIKGGLILALGNEEEVRAIMENEGLEIGQQPDSTTQFKELDMEGGYLLPGLIDMHVHVWDKYEFGLYLSQGVTAVRNLWGMPMHLRMKKDTRSGELIAPDFYTSGPKLTGPEFIGDDNLNLSSPEEAREKVISYKERGYDFIKTYYGLTEELYDAVLEQAEKSEIDLVAHPSQKVPYHYHFNPLIRSIEHAEDIVQQPLNFQLDTIALDQVVAQYRESGGPAFCPTLSSFHNILVMMKNDDILSSEDVELMNPLIREVDSKAQFERWYKAKADDPKEVDRIEKQHEFHLLAVQKLHRAGVNLVSGTDAGIGITVPGFSMHGELSMYRQAGLSNFEVLRTATVNASKVHEEFANMGSIQIGKVANLLIVENNPLENLDALKRPKKVFLKGRMLERNTLDEFIEKARNRPNLISTGMRYLENLIIEK